MGLWLKYGGNVMIGFLMFIICVLLGLMNLPFILNGTGGWYNVASMVFCFIMAVVNLILLGMG